MFLSLSIQSEFFSVWSLFRFFFHNVFTSCIRIWDFVLAERLCFLLCVQNKLQSLTGQHSELLENLSPSVRKRVEDLREIQACPFFVCQS